LDFNGQRAFGLGTLSCEAQRGRYPQPSYAVTPAREPLSITDLWMWARETKDKAVACGPRESLRWIEGYERIADMAVQLLVTGLV
jgi:hypothetical protein